LAKKGQIQLREGLGRPAGLARARTPWRRTNVRGNPMKEKPRFPRVGAERRKKVVERRAIRRRAPAARKRDALKSHATRSVSNGGMGQRGKGLVAAKARGSERGGN